MYFDPNAIYQARGKIFKEIDCYGFFLRQTANSHGRWSMLTMLIETQKVKIVVNKIIYLLFTMDRVGGMYVTKRISK